MTSFQANDITCTYKFVMFMFLTFYLGWLLDLYETLVWNAEKSLTSRLLAVFLINSPLVFPSKEDLIINLCPLMAISKRWCTSFMPKIYTLTHILPHPTPGTLNGSQFVQQFEWITLSAFRVRVVSRLAYSFSLWPFCLKWLKLGSESKISVLM